MSRKISNILVICALVVVFPLLIIGSAFAAYYSINATVSVSIYKGNYTSSIASATVVYNSKANTETFEISGSHAKVITLKANTTGYEFKGWYNGTEESYRAAADVDEVKYFNTEKELKVKLSDYENILAVYEIIPFTITYNVNGTITTETTKGTKVFDDTTTNQVAQNAGLGNATTGNKWAWTDGNGNVVKTAEADITVTLAQVPVEYTITVAGGEGISYTGTAVKVNYNSQNTELAAIFNAENYRTTLEFKSFGAVTYAGNEYTSADALLTAIKNDNANADANITLTPVVDDTFDNIEVTTLRYRAYDIDENLDDAIVYNDEGSEVPDVANQTHEATKTLDNWLKIFETEFYLDAENTDRVEAIEIDVTIDGAVVKILSFNSTTTINDVLAYAYSKHPEKMAKNDTLTISDVLVKLA